MGFRFIEEDFERYVTMAEHGGRHIWHYLEDRLERILAVPFTTNPYVARGDRLQQLWIVPKDTPRPAWPHQAMFYLSRSIEHRELTFGLAVECPPLDWAEQEDLDTNRDGVRLIRCLENAGSFCARLDELAGTPSWSFSHPESEAEDQGSPSKTALDGIKQKHDSSEYWGMSLCRTLTAEEAIAAEEGIVDVIMAAYRSVLPLWFVLVPEADRAFMHEKRGQAVNVWWVNQGDSYAAATREEFLWAPQENEQGRSFIHWRLVRDIGPDDVIVHYYQKAVRGLSRANSETESKTHPHGGDSDWEGEGWMVDVEYFEFDDPIPFDEIREDLSQLDVEHSPFTKSGDVKQGYLWRFDQEGLGMLRDAYDGPWPSWTDIALPIQSLGADQLPDVQPRRPVDLKKALAARGLQYSEWQIATFYTALQTKGFVILSGISGTGKTKLAQAFAEILPQPTEPQVEARDDVISITVQPYMPKYNRFIIPKHFTKLYEPPERGESKEVQLVFGDQSQECRLAYHDYSNTNYIALYLRGEASPWFSENFEVGDTVVMEPRSDDDGKLIGFHMGKPSDPEFREGTSGPVPSNSLFVPVRTDWRDSKSLLGYYNPLTGTYEWTDFLRFLLRAVQSYRQGEDLAWFVILDEMNLARVEYYFADLLSVLESGRDADGWTQEPLRLPYPNDAGGDLPPGRIRVPPNFYVIGTVNVDETTHTFSPKVLDRAFTLELTEADFTDYPPDPSEAPDEELDAEQRRAMLADFTQEGQFTRIDKRAIATYVEGNSEVRDRLQVLNDQLRPYYLHFGYRVFDEIISFLISAERNELFAEMDAAFDAAVLMKVLPKFHGSRGKLEEPLKRILAWCLSPDAPDYETIDAAVKDGEDSNAAIRALEGQAYRYERTAAKACRMLWELYTSGFASFS